MKHRTIVTVSLTAAMIAAASISEAVPKAGAASAQAAALTPAQSAASAQTTLQPRPDLIAQGLSDTKVPMLAVKNIGNAKAGASLLQVECHTNEPGAPSVACQPNVHYANLSSPAIPSPPGLMMTSPNTWRIPIVALDAASGVAKHALGIRPTASQPNGLKLRLCADVTNAVVESNESNNCTTFIYHVPQ
jgi:hypothetical protein